MIRQSVWINQHQSTSEKDKTGEGIINFSNDLFEIIQPDNLNYQPKIYNNYKYHSSFLINLGLVPLKNRIDLKRIKNVRRKRTA